jgi:hypothetical protein
VSTTITNVSKTHCPRGHEYTPENTYVNPTRGYRTCIACKRKKAVERRRQNLEHCKALERARGRRLNSAHRQTAIKAYGGKCACCGEQEEAFLQFDHVDGNGNVHRRSVYAGVNFYRWLIKNAFPPSIQLLCGNCHNAKSHYGVCPHRREVVAV